MYMIYTTELTKEYVGRKHLWVSRECKSGLTLHDFRRTTEQIGYDMSRWVIAGNRGK